MNIRFEKINLKTKGFTDIINITDLISEILKRSGVINGLLTVFIPGATGALTTIEYERGLVEDMKETLEKLIKRDAGYKHDITHQNGNADSHIKASIIGPSISIPFQNGRMLLGRWQEVVFIDFDNNPREREIIVQIIGE